MIKTESKNFNLDKGYFEIEEKDFKSSFPGAEGSIDSVLEENLLLFNELFNKTDLKLKDLSELNLKQVEFSPLNGESTKLSFYKLDCRAKSFLFAESQKCCRIFKQCHYELFWLERPNNKGAVLEAFFKNITDPRQRASLLNKYTKKVESYSDRTNYHIDLEIWSKIASRNKFSKEFNLCLQEQTKLEASQAHEEYKNKCVGEDIYFSCEQVAFHWSDKAYQQTYYKCNPLDINLFKFIDKSTKKMIQYKLHGIANSGKEDQHDVTISFLKDPEMDKWDDMVITPIISSDIYPKYLEFLTKTKYSNEDAWKSFSENIPAGIEKKHLLPFRKYKSDELDALKNVEIACVEKESISYKSPSVLLPGEYSSVGFLGPNENLIEVIKKDQEYIDKMGFTYQELMMPILFLIWMLDSDSRAGHKIPLQTGLFKMNNDYYTISQRSFRGSQNNPFGGLANDTLTKLTGVSLWSSRDYRLKNINTGIEVCFSGLAVSLALTHSFLEGPGSSYRLSMTDIFSVFRGLFSK